MTDIPYKDRPLYEVLRQFRNSIYAQYPTYYPNPLLEELAVKKPTTREEMFEIDPDEEAFELYGHYFVELIRIFCRISFPGKDTSPDSSSSIRQDLERFEISLHGLVLSTLQTKYGDRWWYDGIPEEIRTKAAKLHEESKGEIPRESTLYLLDLKDIVIKQWALFQRIFDLDSKGKKDFEKRIERINDIRNRLSHPVRLQASPVSAEERAFVQTQRALFENIITTKSEK